MTTLDWVELKYSFRNWYRNTWPGKIGIYISNRLHVSHSAKTTLKHGQWYDTDTRLFESVFGLLVQFVEIELANHAFLDDTDPFVIEYKSTSRFNRWKNKQEWNERLGLEYLDWASNLGEESPYQAECAKKTKELYLWYKHERPNRVDPYDKINEFSSKFIDAPGASTLDDRFSRSNQMTEEYKKWLYDVCDLERQQYEEDTRKAQEVLEIRQGLWT